MPTAVKHSARRTAYLFALAVIICCYFYRVLSCRQIFIERDLAPFFIPPKLLWVGLLKSGIFPFWNPYQYCGVPLLAALQPGVLYPPHLFYLLLPFHVVWNWLIILHCLLAGVAVYSFLSHLRSSEEGAFVGGVVFMLSGYLLSVHNLLPHLFAVAWFPLALLFFVKHFQTGRIRHAVFVSLFLLMQFLSGAPEILMMSLLALLIIGLFLPFFVDRQISFYSRTRGLALILILFFLLSAVQILPFYELKAQSIRQGGLTYLESSVWSMAWRDVIQFFIPDPFGNLQNDQKYWLNQSWLKTIYLGLAPFCLSTFYFLTRDRKRWPLALLMVVSMIFALGGNTPLYKILYHIPPFGSVRYPVKFLFLFFFVISVTSGLGLDSLRRGVAEQSRRVQGAIHVFFYMGFVFVLFWAYMVLFRSHVERLFDSIGFKPDVYNLVIVNIHDIRRFFFLAFLFCILLLLYLRVTRRMLLMMCIVLILTLDLFLASYGFYTTIDYKRYLEPPEFVNEIYKTGKTGRYFMTPKTHKTFDRFPKDKAATAPAYAPLWGLYTAEGAEVLRLGHYERFINMLKGAPSLDEARRFLDIAGIRYVVTNTILDNDDFTLLRSLKVGEEPEYLYEYKAFTERFLLFSRVYRARDDQDMIEKLADRTVDLRRELIVLDKGMPADVQIHREVDRPTGGRFYGADLAGDKVEVVSYEPNGIILKCITGREAFLYASDAYYPGWRAYVDGQRTEIVRANLAFRAIKVPPGKHTISFRYVPASFYAGLVLTALGLIISCLLIVGKRR